MVKFRITCVHAYSLKSLVFIIWPAFLMTIAFCSLSLSLSLFVTQSNLIFRLFVISIQICLCVCPKFIWKTGAADTERRLTNDFEWQRQQQQPHPTIFYEQRVRINSLRNIVCAKCRFIHHSIFKWFVQIVMTKYIVSMLKVRYAAPIQSIPM